MWGREFPEHLWRDCRRSRRKRSESVSSTCSWGWGWIWIGCAGVEKSWGSEREAGRRAQVSAPPFEVHVSGPLGPQERQKKKNNAEWWWQEQCVSFFLVWRRNRKRCCILVWSKRTSLMWCPLWLASAVIWVFLKDKNNKMGQKGIYHFEIKCRRLGRKGWTHSNQTKHYYWYTTSINPSLKKKFTK